MGGQEKGFITIEDFFKVFVEKTVAFDAMHDALSVTEEEVAIWKHPSDQLFIDGSKVYSRC